MDSTFAKFDHSESALRIKEILANKDSDYGDRDSIPPRDQLTYENGFYVECVAVFIDLRGSKKLADIYKTPTLAKIYRIYVSEMVALLRSHAGIREIFIEGDCVWAVYDSPYRIDIDAAFGLCYAASSLIDIMNLYLRKGGFAQLTVGVGMAYGNALMIKAGSKGSGINEVVWTGKVVGEAAMLSSYGNKSYNDSEIMVSGAVYNNLSEDNKKLLSFNRNRDCWHGDIIDVTMNAWLGHQT